MLPGTQSNLAAQMAAHASHLVHVAAVHAAVQSTTHGSRNVAVLELADRLVGYLSVQMLQRLGLQSTTRKVLISAESQRHAIHRRAIASQLDAELVASRVAEAFSNVRYLLLPQRETRVFALLGRAESAGKWLLLPLKFIPSESSETRADALWIRTAHPFGQKKFRKAQKKGLLVDLLLKQPSNPSIERTATDEPVSAAHVKR